MTRLIRMELLEYVDSGQPSGGFTCGVAAREDLVIEADMANRVVWMRMTGRSDRFVPFEQVKWAETAEEKAGPATVKVAVGRNRK